MIYVRQPSDEERQELRRMTRQAVGRVSQRAQMILLSADQVRAPVIARIFNVSPATVRYWIGQFDRAGPKGLEDNPRSGRPKTITTAVTETLLTLLRDDPQQAGYLATIWTVAMLGLALFRRLEVTCSVSALRAAMHELGLRWGRPRLTMPAKVDPEKTSKQWAIVQTVLAAGPEATILYADESRIQLLPLVRALWHWLGQQVRLPTPGSNVTRSLFGALNIRTGQWTYLVRNRLRQDDFLAFLEHLLVVYPTGAIVLIVDNYSSHTAKIVRVWVAAQPRLQLCFLPTYCSHLNPVEPIWLRLKNTIAADRLHGSITALLESVATFFADMTDEQALKWAAA